MFFCSRRQEKFIFRILCIHTFMYIFLNMYRKHTYSFFSFRSPRVHWYCKLCEESRFFIGYSNYPFKKRFTGVTLVDEWWWEAFPIRIDLAMNGSRSWKTFKLESRNLDIITLCAKSLLPKKGGDLLGLRRRWRRGDEKSCNFCHQDRHFISLKCFVFFPKEFHGLGGPTFWAVQVVTKLQRQHDALQTILHWCDPPSAMLHSLSDGPQLPWMGCCSLHEDGIWFWMFW